MQFGCARPILIAVACALTTACATSPRPLPPRRVMFAQPPAAPLLRPRDLPTPTEPPIIHERYAGWIFAADALSIVPLTLWMGRPDDVYLALPGLLLPPIIHAAHGETQTAILSLFMRAAMVGGVYLAGRSIADQCAEDVFCYPSGAILLAELAIIPVVTIDAVFLARRTVRDESWHGLPMQPSVGVTADGRKWLSLSGRF